VSGLYNEPGHDGFEKPYVNLSADWY